MRGFLSPTELIPPDEGGLGTWVRPANQSRANDTCRKISLIPSGTGFAPRIVKVGFLAKSIKWRNMMMNSELSLSPSSSFPSPSSREPDFSHRPTRNTRQIVLVEEESLVIDDRSNLSPAQAVESKLSRVFKEASLPVSHLQMRGLLRSR
jgi:hypothetical protein